MHAQSCPTLCDSMDCNPTGSSVSGIFQARVLEWVATSSSRGSSWPRDRTTVSCVSCIGRQILSHWTTWEAPMCKIYTSILKLPTYHVCEISYLIVILMNIFCIIDSMHQTLLYTVVYVLHWSLNLWTNYKDRKMTSREMDMGRS